MNSLDDPDVAATLRRLHSAAARDWFVFLRALPSVVSGALRGKGAVESAIPHLKRAYIPIDAAQGRALYQFVRATRARRVVEFGCSFGVSAIYLGAALRDNGGGALITTEIEPLKANRAQENFAAAGLSDTISVLRGDALETLKSVESRIDMLFLDGWKELCLPVLKLLEPQLAPGASVFCDDIRPFRKTLAPYIDYVRRPNGRYASTLLPLGDGLEFSVRL